MSFEFRMQQSGIERCAKLLSESGLIDESAFELDRKKEIVRAATAFARDPKQGYEERVLMAFFASWLELS